MFSTHILREALRALMRNPIRSALTMLGIIMGVASFICVVAVGNAGSAKVQDQLAKLEGQWPQYPMKLVELADKHPAALPGPCILLTQKVRRLSAPSTRARARRARAWRRCGGRRARRRRR